MVESSSVMPSSNGMLDPTQLKVIKKKRCFRRNFQVNMVREIFDETMKRLNVVGKLGKLKINPVLIQYIKSLTFQACYN